MRDLPRLLAYAPSEVEAAALIETQMAALICVQDGLLLRVANAEGNPTLLDDVAMLAGNVVLVLRERALAGREQARYDMTSPSPLMVQLVDPDTDAPVDPRPIFAEALESILQPIETARAVAEARELINARN